MSITLPPLPEPATFALIQGRAMQGSEFRPLSHDYEPACAQYTTNQMIAYATAAVEADRASRAPMTDSDADDIFTAWAEGTRKARSLIRAVEAHYGVGAKP